MEIILRFKHWHLFLIFIIPTYLIGQFGILTIVLFELIAYYLWLYSISSFCFTKWDEDKYNRNVPVIVNASFILHPLFWFVSFFSSPVISVVASSLWIITLIFIIYFTSKALKEVGAEINQFWIATGFLLPFIGVWFIQPMINRLYQKRNT